MSDVQRREAQQVSALGDLVTFLVTLAAMLGLGWRGLLGLGLFYLVRYVALYYRADAAWKRHFSDAERSR